MSTPPQGGAAPLKRSRSSVWQNVPLVLGIYLLASLFFPEATGYAALQRAAKDPEVVTRFFVAFAFLFLSGVIADKNRLARILDGIMDVVNQQIYGPSYKEERVLVDGLIRTLSSEDAEKRASAAEALAKVTGKSFGQDQTEWARWWGKARSTFRARRADDRTPPRG